MDTPVSRYYINNVLAALLVEQLLIMRVVMMLNLLGLELVLCTCCVAAALPPGVWCRQRSISARMGLERALHTDNQPRCARAVHFAHGCHSHRHWHTHDERHSCQRRSSATILPVRFDAMHCQVQQRVTTWCWRAMERSAPAMLISCTCTLLRFRLEAFWVLQV